MAVSTTCFVTLLGTGMGSINFGHEYVESDAASPFSSLCECIIFLTTTVHAPPCCLQLQARTDKGKRKKGDDGGQNQKRQRTQKRQAYD